MKKIILSISMLLLTIVVAQQPLEELAPPGALLSLGISYHANLGTTLKQDFEALDWDSATETVSKLAKILISSEKFPDINDFLFSLEEGINAFAELEQICPGISEKLAGNSHSRSFELLETMGLGSISSPSITILLRSEDSDSGLPTKFDALIECAQKVDNIPTLDQDGTKLYILNDGGDMPFIVTKFSNLIVASTSPDDVRSVIRLANGGSEKSLADSYIYRQSQALLKHQENSLRISIDFEAVANTIQKLTGIFVRGSENRAALDRALSSFYTLGGNTYQISAVEDGVLKENILTINPEGGDEALLKLLKCPSCQVLIPPTMAPQQTIAIKMNYLPWRQSFDYLQSLANDIGAIYGQPEGSIDIKELTKRFLDFDLDVALFNWLGSEIHSYTLEPVSANLNTLVYSPAQLTVIPVRSVEAAEAGIEELISLLLPMLEDYASTIPKGGAIEEMLAFSDKLEGLDFGGIDFSEIASSQYQYKNILINRIRLGINTDFSYAFVNSNLILATPAKAIEALIDTYESGLNIYLNQDFRSAKQSAPLGSSSFSYTEVGVTVNSLADLLDIFSQPLAYGINKFLNMKINNPDSESNSETNDDVEFIVDDVFDADIAGITVNNAIFPESSVVASLSEDDIDNYGYFSHYYLLKNVNAGDEITVSLSSEEFDTQVWLIDSKRSVYIEGNDDIADTDSSDSLLNFVVQEGNDYWLEVSSFNGDGVGQYELDVSYTNNVAQTAITSTEATENVNEVDFADLEGMTATDIALSNTVSGNLSSGQIDNYGNTTVFYHLLGISNNDIVKLSLSSEDFDTQMWLADREAEAYLADNDDKNEDSTDSYIVFKAKDSEDYWVEVTSYDNLSEGSFVLTVELGNETELDDFTANTVIAEDIVEADIEGMVATPIAVGSSINGNLSEEEIDNYGTITDFYEITGLSAGDSVTVRMSSAVLDAQLWLVDVNNKTYLADNDDADDETIDAEINFVAEEGIKYWVEASTSGFGDSAVGEYSFSVSLNDSANNENLNNNSDWLSSASIDDLTAEDIPSFPELLKLFDMLPNSLRVLANHTSNSVGYSKTLGDNIYSRKFCKFSW